MTEEKKTKKYDINYANLAIPEIHTGEAAHPEVRQQKENITYDTVAIPEIHIHRKVRTDNF